MQYYSINFILCSTISEAIKITVENMHSGQNSFKNFIDPQETNTHLRESIDKIYDFIFAQDQSNPPDMRSAQIKNLSVKCICDEFSIFWKPQTYPDVDYNFENFSYPFRNLEDRYRIYWNGNLIATVSNAIHTYQLSTDCGCQYPIPEGVWMVIAYQSVAGNSYKGLVYAYPSMEKQGQDNDRIYNTESMIHSVEIFPNPNFGNRELQIRLYENARLEIRTYDINGNEFGQMRIDLTSGINHCV